MSSSLRGREVRWSGCNFGAAAKRCESSACLRFSGVDFTAGPCLPPPSTSAITSLSRSKTGRRMR